MVALTWLRGLLAHRPGRMLATAAGVAVGVALLASIGTFLSSTNSKMTQRAAARVPVDWQVETQRGADPRALLAKVKHHPAVERALPVGLTDTTGLRASTGGSAQHTGPGKVIGLPPGYAKAFPGEVRSLSGSSHGVVLAQQTAANLRAKPGDKIAIGRPGMGAARVKVAGVVELPAADSLFQRAGAPVGAQPQAAPDNVVLLHRSTFERVEGPVARTRPDAVKAQVHAAVDRSLPGSPSSAYTKVSGQARNLETALAGSGLVGDNLGSALDQARKDALYAELLFLFLGTPGAILAGLVTASIASAGADRRRSEAAVMRTRGASTRRLVAVALGEAAVAGGIGVAAGLAGALLIGKAAFGTASFGAGTLTALLWGGGAAAAGLGIAAAAVALPAWRDGARSPWPASAVRWGAPTAPRGGPATDSTSPPSRGRASCTGRPRRTATTWCSPEGVPQVSVNWYALLAPLLAWVGAGLLAFRLADLVLVRGRTPLARVLWPLAGELSPIVAATMGRQRRLLARAVALVALTAAFAGSTAVFNATYQQQAEVDARLSNGADVTVTEWPSATLGPSGARAVERTTGVRSVEPVQHRFAYVGADLQDLYGVRPQTIGAAGKLQDAWFAGGSAKQLMSDLAKRPDDVLVSAETVRDFQLHPGDLVRLRLQNGRTKQFKTVPFHYAGVAKEFPTAPTDSLLVANAGYVAKATGTDAVGSFLVQTDGTSPTVGGRLRSPVRSVPAHANSAASSGASRPS